MRLARALTVPGLAAIILAGCLHNVERDLTYATSQPRDDVRIVARGDTLEFETLYLEGDSLGGRVTDEPEEVRIHVDDVESLYTREVRWLPIMWATVGALTLLDFIATRGADP